MLLVYARSVMDVSKLLSYLCVWLQNPKPLLSNTLVLVFLRMSIRSIFSILLVDFFLFAQGWVPPSSSCARRQRNILWDTNPRRPKAEQETLNWCTNFVAKQNLCPWAAASVQTKRAIDIRLVHGGLLELETMIAEACKDFRQAKKDPNTAITFVVLESQGIDFESFYNWFVDFEDSWVEDEDNDDITLASFHPDWCFASDNTEDLVLSFEKKTPYPTVSIVSADVIDRAGETATKQIGLDNEKTLLAGSFSQWQHLYDQAIRGTSTGDSTVAWS